MNERVQAHAVDAYVCNRCVNLHLVLSDEDGEVICEAVITREQLLKLTQLATQ